MDDTLVLVGGSVAGLLVLAVVVKVVVSLARRGPAAQSDAKVKELVQAGDYDAAGTRALVLNDLGSAYELFLRGQQLQKAAEVAQKLGRVNVAAELFERDGEFAQAMKLYRDLQMHDKAREMEAAGAAKAARVDEPPPTAPAAKPAPKVAAPSVAPARPTAAASVAPPVPVAAPSVAPAPPAPPPKAPPIAAPAAPRPRRETPAAPVTPVTPVAPVAPVATAAPVANAANAAKGANAANAVASPSEMPPSSGQDVPPTKPSLERMRGAAAPATDANASGDAAGVLANDDAVRAARSGPSPDDLRRMLGGGGPDLANIEVYYRLGLACSARGELDDAREAFAAVEEVSPGYRDAWRRLEELEAVKKAVAPAAPIVNAAGGPPKLERYEIATELGRGGSAIVYLARDEELGRDVALKVLNEVGDAPFNGEFKREARAAATLNHPSIVTIFDSGVADGHGFVGMELVDGTSIASTLEKTGPLKLGDALRIAESVLLALEYAHEKKIVHRDIKPTNVMQSASGVVKLMDVGLAKPAVVGAGPSFLAPEQLTIPARDVDARTDLFAVGALLYAMLSGKAPFEGRARSNAPRSLRELVPTVPPLVQSVVDRALAPEKAHRFASATDMLAPLRACLAAVPPEKPRPPMRGKQATMLGVAPTAVLGPAPARDLPKSDDVVPLTKGSE